MQEQNKNSFKLHLLNNQVNRCYGKYVIKASVLTRVAVGVIGGSTLHRNLKLPVQKDGRIIQMPLLTGIYLRQMGLQRKEITFIFIDKTSVIPHEMLCMTD